LEPTKETLPGGRSVANPVSTDGGNNLAEGDLGFKNDQLCNYHCGITNPDGSTYGEGWYGTDDYMQFAFTPNTNNSELPVTWAANSVNEQTAGARLPFEPYSGVDPNSGRNAFVFGTMTAPTTFPPGPVGLVPNYLDADLLMLGRGFLTGGAGTAAAPSSRFAPIAERQAAKFFMKAGHGESFGLTGAWNASRAAEVSSVINRHINSDAVLQIAGTYRGNAVTHFVQPSSGLNIFLDASGGFGGGWKLGANQLQSVLTTGRLF
jgi:hypothetical protein